MEATLTAPPFTSKGAAPSFAGFAFSRYTVHLCRNLGFNGFLRGSPVLRRNLDRRRRFSRLRAESSRHGLELFGLLPAARGFGDLSCCSDKEMAKNGETGIVDKNLSPVLVALKSFDGSQWNVWSFLRTPICVVVFCVVTGLIPNQMLQRQAIAAPAVAKTTKRTATKEERLGWKEHEYAVYTRSLLDTVAVLLKRIQAVRIFWDSKTNPKVRAPFASVETALEDVKVRKARLQREIFRVLNAELSRLRKDKSELIVQAENALKPVTSARRELLKLRRSGKEGREVTDRIKELEMSISAAEAEYNGLWEKADEIDEEISRKETRVYSIVVRELMFIEKECETLVRRFKHEWEHSTPQREDKGSTNRLSVSDIREQLEKARLDVLEQLILPSLVESSASDALEPSIKDFVVNIKHVFKESREMQRHLESSIRKKMRKHGEERLFLQQTPAIEAVKGYPELEVKWTFGKKEVVLPNAVSHHLYHGWKQWREEAKANLKQKLLEDSDHAKQYLAKRQERILIDRDRVVAKTWYNEARKRWEIDPLAVPYALSKKLVDYIRIRHDWAVFYVMLKGDNKSYFVDVLECDMVFEDFGGFDGLYIKMLASGVPTAVQWMWIPFSELDLVEQLRLFTKMFYKCLVAFWNFEFVANARESCLSKLTNINADIMVMIGFPTLEFLIPKPIRTRLGMVWPEEESEIAGFSTWYLKWQAKAEMIFRARKRNNLRWFLWFVIRSVIYGYLIFNVIRFARKRVPRVLGYGPFRRNPNMKKLNRVKAYFRFKFSRRIRQKNEGVDPIKAAFEQMKRVKNPPIWLRDFASVDSMREEIIEIVAFLKNPTAFQQMGARAPRGVLIVGERGTGKTSLALAIAAEARVPVVEVKARQLEAGLWVGQSASNVRELFQTARDLAPVIIFVEDFDLFAGVRGEFIHTVKQDHEAFINQLLVELDGFEKQEGVVLLATTSNLKQVDPALRRPGRMDRILHLQRPTQLEREKILYTAAKDTMDEQLVGYVDWKKVAEKTALLRPIELKVIPMSLEAAAFRNRVLDADELMNYCCWFMGLSHFIPSWFRQTAIMKSTSRWLVNHLGLTLTKEDLESVVDLMEPYGQISNGIEFLSPPLNWTRETKFPHAVWAAGRGLIALLLPNFDQVDNVWLEPASWEGIGCTKITKAKSEGPRTGNVETRVYLEKKLVFCFGSYVAAQILLPFGEENYLSSSELQQAQEIATRMVVQYGWGPDDNPTIYFCSNSSFTLSMGDSHEYEMAAKVEKLYYSAYEKAKQMLQKNHRVLEIFVEQLLEYEMLSGMDMVRIFEENGGIREVEPFMLLNHFTKEPSSNIPNATPVLT
ncbi:probable inactive ATP-dependent zinc metalloprotease FTSHI 5, chloroplastic isoform X2 [Nymphaea colorata]|uniref:probable inactive ATP-dependent zinc metalloprotease FTSHI 5, chloroplastic isoform X2 n=1 Tax=Nymphaea colorata TaxID=210225 RepID=UPI00129D3DEE|nr:probable inactive ATP-dependent zinc metalloprotease FTSHI 5, chloroplastic isoform X2 [Nymphaea colorata]